MTVPRYNGCPYQQIKLDFITIKNGRKYLKYYSCIDTHTIAGAIPVPGIYWRYYYLNTNRLYNNMNSLLT